MRYAHHESRVCLASVGSVQCNLYQRRCTLFFLLACSLKHRNQRDYRAGCSDLWYLMLSVKFSLAPRWKFMIDCWLEAFEALNSMADCRPTNRRSAYSSVSPIPGKGGCSRSRSLGITLPFIGINTTVS